MLIMSQILSFKSSPTMLCCDLGCDSQEGFLLSSSLHGQITATLSSSTVNLLGRIVQLTILGLG